MAPVLIIGAGAAGLTAAYKLNKAGINYKILEASDRHGGRMKKAPIDFADISIDLGGEWIHRNPSVLDKILEKEVSDEIETFKYRPPYQEWNGNKFVSSPYDPEGNEHKFVNSTWYVSVEILNPCDRSVEKRILFCRYDFFEEYVVPDVEDNLFQCAVKSIKWSNNPVVVTCSDETVYEGSEVIVTVPISILQSDNFQFNPKLPSKIQKAINAPIFPAGQKVFLKFTEEFYPSSFQIKSDMDSITLKESARFFYSETYGQSSEENIMGVFIYGDLADPYKDMSDDAIIDDLLHTLEGIFPGKVLSSFSEGIVQNWSKEEYIFGAYSDFLNKWRKIKVLRSASPGRRIFFAGEAVPVKTDKDGYEWGECMILVEEFMPTLVLT